MRFVVVQRLCWDTGGWGRPEDLSAFLSPQNHFAGHFLQCMRMDCQEWEIIFRPAILMDHASPSIAPAYIKVTHFSSFLRLRLDRFSMTMFSFDHWFSSASQALSCCDFVQRGVIEIGRLNHLDLLDVDRSKGATSGDRQYRASRPIQMADSLSLPILMLPLVMV